ncbi:hypothetical protein CR513_26853, partial [Mucuna pruriens]
MDDFSRAMWIYLLAEKSEVASTLKKFCTVPNSLTFRSLGVYVMHIIDLDKKTSLVIEVENVFLWATLMEKGVVSLRFGC